MFQRTIFILMLTLFSLLVLVGLNFSMPYGPHSQAMVCPLMEHTTRVCPMDTAEHIAAWQRLFTTTPQDEIYLLIVLALLISYIFYRFIYPNTLLEERYKRYKYDHPDSSLYNYFKRVFSRGILQPKLYA